MTIEEGFDMKRMTTEEELKKGCGKKINCGNYHLYCGESGMNTLRLCQSCKAELKGFLAGKLASTERCLKELKKDIEIMEEVYLDLFGKQQVRWRHTKLTKMFNDILERNSKKLYNRVEELTQKVTSEGKE